MDDDNRHNTSLAAGTRQRLYRLEHRARKSLGQHFLIDAGILAKICRAADLQPSDTVLEVGPGLGVLTAELVRQTRRVVAVELDRKLADGLPEIVPNADNLRVVNADILKTDLRELLPDGGGQPVYKVVANLPYYITSAVIRFFLEAPVLPVVMVVMVQREVARAIVAKPGDMGLLALSVQIYGRPEIVCRVPAGAFYPAPAVDSAVLRIWPHASPLIAPDDVASFFELAKAGFCAPRKQLQNALAQGLERDKNEVLALLARAGIDPRRRPETLTVAEWITLWQKYREGVS